MHCPYCGKEISENAKVCPYCGREQKRGKAQVDKVVEAKPPEVARPVVDSAKKEKVEKKEVIARQQSEVTKAAANFPKKLKGLPKWIWTAVGLLVVILIITLVFGEGQKTATPETAADADAGAGGGPITSTSESSYVGIDGNWIGEIKGADSTFSAILEVTIEGECFPGEICGTYGIVGASCHGDLELLAIDQEWVFEFIERETTGGEGCVSGGHQYLQASGSDRLSYGFILDPSVTDYFQTTGILERK